MTKKTSGPCIIRGCQEPGTCLDHRCYTKWRIDLNGMGPKLNKIDGREIWYCPEHAVEYLFPLIDNAEGNSTYALIGEFIKEGFWGK